MSGSVPGIICTAVNRANEGPSIMELTNMGCKVIAYVKARINKKLQNSKS